MKINFFEDISPYIYYTIWNFENKIKQRSEAFGDRQKLIKKRSITPEPQNMGITYVTVFVGSNASCLYKWPSPRSALTCLPVGYYALTLSCSLSPRPPICGHLRVTEMPVCVTATLGLSYHWRLLNCNGGDILAGHRLLLGNQPTMDRISLYIPSVVSPWQTVACTVGCLLACFAFPKL